VVIIEEEGLILMEHHYNEKEMMYMNNIVGTDKRIIYLFKVKGHYR